MPFFFEAAILSRMRSPVTSRSNWANDNSTLRVSRPIELVVLNCWVTETNEHAFGVEDLDQPGKVGKRSRQPVDLVDDHDVNAAGLDIGEQALHPGPFQLAAGEPAIVITGPRQHPALVLLATNIGLTRIALRRERIEFLLEPFLGGFARVDGAALVASPQHRRLRLAGRSQRTLVRAVGEPIGSTSAQKTAGPTTRSR